MRTTRITIILNTYAVSEQSVVKYKEEDYKCQRRIHESILGVAMQGV